MIILQKLIPQILISKWIGRLFASEIIWLKKILIACFCRKYTLQLQEAQITNAQQYPSLQALFTRQLKPNARPIAQDQAAFSTPVDGTLSEFGIISAQKIWSIKNKKYELKQLVIDPTLATQCAQCPFATFYLAPHNYHRIHMPYDGFLKELIYIPGRLFSVNPKIVASMPDLFTRNERLVAVFDTKKGPMVMVWVAALLVGGIVTSWDGVQMPHQLKEPQFKRLAQPRFFAKGDELGYFKFGSSVVCIWPKSSEFVQDLTPNQSVQMGQVIARFKL